VLGVGGNSIRAPKASTWTGTFGGYVLCGRESDTRIEVQRIRYEASIDTEVRGWHVNESCEQTAALERQLSEGQVPSRPLKELMFVVTANPRGAKIEQVDIDYLADGRPKTLELHWTMVSCGSATVGPDACQH
jgi:hypothetical protein